MRLQGTSNRGTGLYEEVLAKHSPVLGGDYLPTRRRSNLSLDALAPAGQFEEKNARRDRNVDGVAAAADRALANRPSGKSAYLEAISLRDRCTQPPVDPVVAAVSRACFLFFKNLLLC